MAWQLACLSTCLLASQVFSAETNSAAETEAAYTRTINQRVDKIVATLGIVDTNKAMRVQKIITLQYRALRSFQDSKQELLGALKTGAGEQQRVIEEGSKPIIEKFKDGVRILHGEFLTSLSADLSAEQVDKVKDEMTYGVLPLTYGVYLKMYPDLTDEQKSQIKAWLTEARELAMDGSTSNEKHAVFGKYKGKINNYLSKAGYDAKKAEQNLKKPAAPTSDSRTK